MVDLWIYFYYGHGQTDRQTGKQTTLVVKLLSRLKTQSLTKILFEEVTVGHKSKI